MRKLIILASACLLPFSGYAHNYVVVSNDTKVYDQPSVKGYVTLNGENAELMVSGGMAFKCREIKNGWAQIEYVPGISGFIMESQIDMNPALPSPGSYKLANGDSSFEITLSGDKWSLKGNGTELSGVVEGNVVIFNDRFGNPLYTLVKTAKGTFLFNYSPELTKFI